jgi:hypothetical protein
MLFPTGLNGKCGGKRITEFNAASEDAMTFLCSGSHRNTNNIMGCHFAHDGVSKPDQDPNVGATINSWRPQCGADNGGCQVKEAWIGVHFPTPTYVGCMQLLGSNGSPSSSLGKGVGLKSDPWDGGLAVEVSDDGENWQAVEIEAQDCRDCNLNIALIVDGKP